MKTKRTNFLLSVSVAILASLLTTSLQAVTIVDDDWSDGNRAKTGALDSNWWYSSNSNGIEDAVGSLGLVTGTSGRGIHTVFPTQTLAVGDILKATYTFKTPATVGVNKGNAFKVGLFDTLGRAGLNGDITASSGSPNDLYGFWFTDVPGLPGYMMDMDVNTGATADLNIRRSETADNDAAFSPTGRLMGTNTGFTSLGDGPGEGFTFDPNTTYTGSFSVRRVSATQMLIGGTLGATSFQLAEDPFESASYGFLGFWANSNTFGSSSSADTADNGIDFTNVKVELIIPEPATLALFLGALISFPGLVRRR